MWPELRRQQLEALIHDPKMAELTAKDVDRLCRETRDMMFMKTTAMSDYWVRDDHALEVNTQIFTRYHAKISKDRKRYYGEPLPPLDDFLV
jgi:hypothetical protein